MNRLTNKLNFSLTKKRLILIGKRISVAQLYSKALPALIAFSFSPFLFFNPFFGPKAFPYTIAGAYSDVELQRKSLITEGESVYSLARIPYIVLTKSGKPFTGVQKTYSKETDRHVGTNIFEDGLIVHLKVFNEGGDEFSSVDVFYDAHKTKKTSARYYLYGSLRSEMIFSSPEHDGKRVFKFWNSEGYLDAELISESAQVRSEFTEIIRYDREGNVESKEQWKKER